MALSQERRAVPDTARHSIFCLRARSLFFFPWFAFWNCFPISPDRGFAVRYSSSMNTSPLLLPCDGCGLPASPAHIAARVRRLELSTRFRPVHISVLFVAPAPPDRVEDDFYAAPEKSQLLGALGISNVDSQSPAGSDASALLGEFQHRGYYLAYLSECPADPSGSANGELAPDTVARLAPTLIRRIRFNYKPKLIAPLGPGLLPLVAAFRAAGVGPVLTQNTGQPLPVPRPGDKGWQELFQRAVTSAAPSDHLSAGV